MGQELDRGTSPVRNSAPLDQKSSVTYPAPISGKGDVTNFQRWVIESVLGWLTETDFTQDKKMSSCHLPRFVYYQVYNVR
jgi:hypothetical protein